MGMLICETLGGSGSFIRVGLWGQGHMSDTGGIPVPTILFIYFFTGIPHFIEFHFIDVVFHRCCIFFIVLQMSPTPPLISPLQLIPAPHQAFIILLSVSIGYA